MKDKTTWSSQLIDKIALDKVQHTFMIKPLNNLGNYHNIIKAIYDKSTGNIIMVKIWKLRCRTFDDYTHTHSHTHTYMCIYIYIYMHIHIHIYIYIYMLLYKHTLK